MTASACLVCGAGAFEPRFEILRRCRSCGFVTARIDGTPDARRLYGDGYFRGEEYLDYRADEAFFKKSFRPRLREVLRRTPGGRLLEIGSAYGFFLDLAKEHFDVVGFEVNEAGARHAREAFGVDVRTDDFLAASADQIGAPVDVAVMWDVIEHLERPDRFVARIAEISRPGALLYVTTGDAGSALARWRGRKWRMIHPPTHLHYFSRSTLSRLLANHGFRVIETRAIGVARSLRQVFYSILVLRMRRPAFYQSCSRFLPPEWGFTLNTYDIMQVIAERTPE
jgi:SAM-dependent methyltransferase